GRDGQGPDRPHGQREAGRAQGRDRVANGVEDVDDAGGDLRQDDRAGGTRPGGLSARKGTGAAPQVAQDYPRSFGPAPVDGPGDTGGRSSTLVSVLKTENPRAR